MIPEMLMYSKSVIAVPGYGTPAVEEWEIDIEVLKAGQSNANKVSHVHLYEYQSPFTVNDEFSWQSFLDSGKQLANNLAEIAAQVGEDNTCSPAKLTPLSSPIDLWSLSLILWEESC